MDAFDVLRELINDIEGAYAPSRGDSIQDCSEVDEEKLGWPDLMITYHHAKTVLEIHKKESG